MIIQGPSGLAFLAMCIDVKLGDDRLENSGCWIELEVLGEVRDPHCKIF